MMMAGIILHLFLYVVLFVICVQVEGESANVMAVGVLGFVYVFLQNTEDSKNLLSSYHASTLLLVRKDSGSS